VPPNDASKAEFVELIEDLQQRVADLEAELEQRDEEIETLEARLRPYENPHTSPSKQRDPSSASAAGDDDDDPETDGGTCTVGRYLGHEPAW